MASTLMSLPRELRYMIYELCLPIGKELVLKPTACDQEDIAASDLQAAPFPALLQVNSIVRGEAAAIFYRKNTWRIMDIPKGLQLPEIFNEHVREATVRFDRRIFKIYDLWDISDKVFETETWTKRRREEIHDRLKERLLGIWTDKCRILGQLRLKKLTVDFTRCKCPLGCCRMVENVLVWLVAFGTLHETRKVIATGIVFEIEAKVIHEAGINWLRGMPQGTRKACAF